MKILVTALATVLFFGHLLSAAETPDVNLSFDAKNPPVMRFEQTVGVDFQGAKAYFWWCDRFKCEPIGKIAGYTTSELNDQLQKTKALDPTVKAIATAGTNAAHGPKTYLLFDKPYLQNGKKYMATMGNFSTTCLAQRTKAKSMMPSGKSDFTCSPTAGFSGTFKLFEIVPKIDETRKHLSAALLE